VRFATTSRPWQPSRTRSSKRFLVFCPGFHRDHIFSDNFTRSSMECPDRLLACVDTFLRWFSSSRFPRPRRHQGERCPVGGEISCAEDAASIVSRALHGKRPFGVFVWKLEPFILGARGKCVGTIRRRKEPFLRRRPRRLGSTFPPMHTATRVPAKESADWRTPLALLVGRYENIASLRTRPARDR